MATMLTINDTDIADRTGRIEMLRQHLAELKLDIDMAEDVIDDLHGLSGFEDDNDEKECLRMWETFIVRDRP